MTILVTFNCSLLIWFVARIADDSWILIICLLLAESIDLDHRKFIIDLHLNLAAVVISAFFNYLKKI